MPKAFTLIELICVISLIAVICLSIFSAFNFVYDLTEANHARINALNLAQEKIELIKNMDYQLIGLVGGEPPGNLTGSEDIQINNLSFQIFYQVNWIDDPYDLTAPADTAPHDYKRVQVSVTADTKKAIKPVVLVTDITD